MQSQVLKFLLKENKFNSQAQGIKVIFLPTPPPPFAQWLFSRSVRKQHNVFEDKEIPKMPLVMWCMYFVYIQQFGRVGFFFGGGGGLCLRFPIWMLSCFLMWSDGIAHMDEGGGGGDKEGGIKPPAAKKQHIIFPSIERVLVKFSYLLLNTTLLNEKPFDGVFWFYLTTVGKKNDKPTKMLFVCTHPNTPTPPPAQLNANQLQAFVIDPSRYDLERMFRGMFLIKRVGKGRKRGSVDSKTLLYFLFIFAKPACWKDACPRP